MIKEFEHVVYPGVTFSGKNFTMTCPREGNWFRKPSATAVSHGEALEKAYDDTSKGQYYCEYGDATAKEKYYFYVQARGE